MAVSAVFAIGVFLYREAGRAMDLLTKILGGLMILLVCYMAIITRAPLGRAVAGSLVPDRLDFFPIVTLLGGTVGGYISFSGIHRLLDAGVTGPERLSEIRRSAVFGISIAAIMRFLLFLSVLGVVSQGILLDPANPPASAFKSGAGMVGYRLFGIVLWSAAITSVVGAAFTSVSFVRTFSRTLEKRSSIAVIGFIIVSALMFLAVGRPITLLVLAGSLNGLILPMSLGIVLLAAWKTKLVAGYRPSRWLLGAGAAAAVVSLFAAVYALQGIASMWR
jgi:Mn2+/Fe2+ NRAMP family transporter